MQGIDIEVEDLDLGLAEELRQTLVGAPDDLARIAQHQVTEALPVYLDRPTRTPRSPRASSTSFLAG
ncbi:hypothetical protein [Methylobacterium frigidaeris]|uniref:Uncharacterized protein n=1 Tax=Methylobacterium frigidaeris TaxID=2038277 RepID=A0AA37HHQ0_9HYPH|nr:hypothetical protein [Methylobacterium frigidaeris]GJD65766.1 hypothetical protein MPEAHAMD_5961 [Methylobacterium frigidaeris]